MKNFTNPIQYFFFCCCCLVSPYFREHPPLHPDIFVVSIPPFPQDLKWNSPKYAFMLHQHLFFQVTCILLALVTSEDLTTGAELDITVKPGESEILQYIYQNES